MLNFKQPIIIGLIIYISFTLLSCNTKQANPKEDLNKKPNIIYIMADDHTAQAWGVYGSLLDTIVKTPNIHRLANEGMLLNNVFCTNSICTPSRATILTGQYSHLNGVYTLSEALDPNKENVAKLLQQNGYQTAVIGKWHLKSQPAGFDFYNVLPGQGRYHNPILRDSVTWNQGGKEYEGFSADVIAGESINWLEQVNKEEPFFLMCHFKATHEPFDYPERHKDLYKDVEVPEPSSLLDFYPEKTNRTFQGQILDILAQRYANDKNGRYPQDADSPEGFNIEGLDQTAIRKKTYQKFIKDFMRGSTAIDDNIGKLLDYLDEKGLSENTIVIYTADQGYFLGEHGFFDKRMMYEEALRMPFVIRYPKEIEPAQKLDDIILNIDFAPLFLDYAGISSPNWIQGQSFRENLTGNKPVDWRNDFYYRYWLHQPHRPAHFGIRNERYKLIFFYGQALDMPGAINENTNPTWEFYDLQEDPKELNNAFNDPKYQEVIAKMKQRLIELKNQTGDTDNAHPIVNDLLEQNL
ncbi:MAG: acetylglucosamine-6-sulfatase [Thalassobius sp.]|nr:acetylglucosamine-6-sulfatase [Thalassovita sp.]